MFLMSNWYNMIITEVIKAFVLIDKSLKFIQHEKNPDYHFSLFDL